MKTSLTGARAFMCFAATLMAGAAHAEVVRYIPASVIKAMHTIDPQLHFVIAHRGVYGVGCPENSVCALEAATNAGIEAAEIDVKESADGTLWLSHDQSIGRETNYAYDGQQFNPNKPNTGTNALANPLISKVHDVELSRLLTKDPKGTVTGYHVANLKGILAVAKQDFPNLVLVLDIKTATAVATAASLINDAGLANAVIMKFSSTSIKPAQVQNYTHGLPFVPTIYLPDLDAIVDAYRQSHPNGPVTVTNQDMVDDYLDGFVHGQAGFIYAELGMKEWPYGPMHNTFVHLNSLNVPLGNFSPTPEVPPDQYYGTLGTCCGTLNQFLYKAKYFDPETVDNRPDLKSETAFFDSVISDAATSALRYEQANGTRAHVLKLVSP